MSNISIIVTKEDRNIMARGFEGYSTWIYEDFTNRVYMGECRIARENFGSIRAWATACVNATEKFGTSDNPSIVY